MNKTKVTKAVVGHMINYSTATAATLFFRQYRNHSEHMSVEIAINASTFVTAYAVSGVVMEPVKQHAESQIDSAIAWYNETFKN